MSWPLGFITAGQVEAEIDYWANVYSTQVANRNSTLVANRNKRWFSAHPGARRGCPSPRQERKTS